MPRAIWSGAITFGLVNVPVRMFSAVSEHKLHFHYVHRKDESPIGYQKICKKEGREVPDREIVKAFEYEKGEWVYMEDEDFEAAQVEGGRAIEITDFVPISDIDPAYFNKTYYLAPQDGAEKVYTLLVRALEKSGLAGIAKFVMRDRQYLGCLRIRDGVITLEQMHFADEVRPPDDVAPESGSVSNQELEMALQLIESFSGDFEPDKYRDTYRDELCAVIKAKRRGEEVHRAPEEAEEKAPDLLSALRASIEQAQRGGGAPARSSTNGGGDRNGDLEDLSKEELLERAREADIPGRSKMSKRELVDALERA